MIMWRFVKPPQRHWGRLMTRVRWSRLSKRSGLNATRGKHPVGKDPVERVLLEKIMNMEQEEFAEIIKERSKSLETMQDPCTAEDIIGLLSGSSAQARWIVACGVVEISCYDSATIDKIFENPINIFWAEISTYTDLITRADCDEIANVLNRLPPVLISQIGGGLYNFALAKSKEANAVCKQNRRKVTTIFEDPGLAKVILSRI